MPGARTRLGIAAVVLLLLPGVEAQRAASSALVLEVKPEARVEPSSVAFELTVGADGGITRSTMVTAWARALPGHAIHLQAQLTALNGPDGAVSADGVGWNAVAGQASGGGRGAACVNGNFAGDGWQDLAQGWNQSGTLQCAVSFQAAAGALPPGVYTGTARLSVAN